MLSGRNTVLSLLMRSTKSQRNATPISVMSAESPCSREMLKLLEGAEVEVPVGASSKNAMVPMTMVNTKNILFICGGAFPELEDIIKERLNKSASIGFKSELKDKYDQDENILQKVTIEDVRKFGMIPEFLGRLPIMFTLEALTEDMLVRILKEPKNAILKQYQKLLAMDEVRLEFEDDALMADRKAGKGKESRCACTPCDHRGFYALISSMRFLKDDNIGMVTITKEYVEKKGDGHYHAWLCTGCCCSDASLTLCCQAMRRSVYCCEITAPASKRQGL